MDPSDAWLIEAMQKRLTRARQHDLCDLTEDRMWLDRFIVSSEEDPSSMVAVGLRSWLVSLLNTE